MKLDAAGVFSAEQRRLFEAKWNAVHDALDRRPLTSLARVAANCLADILLVTKGLDAPHSAVIVEWAARFSGEALELFWPLYDNSAPK